MNVAEAVRAIIKASPYTKTQVGVMTGIGPQGITNTLGIPAGRGITTTKLLKITNALGYRVVLVPVEDNLSEGSVIIDE